MGLVGRKTTVLLGGAAMAIAVGAFQAAAQNATPEEEETVAQEEARQGGVTVLQRIVVGAGQEKVAIDTPQAVSVVEQEDIDRAQGATVGEVLRQVPGVNTASSDRAFGQSFNIRGIGGSESAGEEGRIILNVDGAVKFYEQYRMGGFFSDPELYKRIEVLRGPASSTLYGSGALGGVINFVTKDASDFIAEGDSGALRLKGGYNSNRNGWLGSVIFAQKITEDFDFLLAGNYRRSGVYRTGDGSDVISSDFEAWSGLAKATWNVGEEGKLRLSYQQWDSEADDQSYVQIGGTPGTIGSFGTVDRHVVDRTAVLSYENPFSGNDMLDLKLSASVSQTAVDQTDAEFVAMCEMLPTFNILCDTQYDYLTLQFKAENTSTWYGDTWENHLTYGWQTSHQTRSADFIRPSGGSGAFQYHPEGTDLKSGIYVQNEFVWDERLTLIPGVRVDWRKLTPGGSTPLTDDSSEWAISPKFAAHYKFNDTFAVFGSIAHTERFPTLDEVFSTETRPGGSYGLKKERSNNYELGFAVSTYDLLQQGDGLQFKTTAFYNNVTDLIVSCAGAGAPCGAVFTEHYMNIDSARIYGAELEMAYDSDYVFASASYSHVRGKNTRTDTYLNTVAPHELAFTLGGKLPEHGLSFGWRSRFVAAPQNPALRSPTPVPTANSVRFAESFNVHDVFLTWKPQDNQFEGWEVMAGIDNIFDKQYKEFLHNEPAKGRTFKISLSKQFGW